MEVNIGVKAEDCRKVADALKLLLADTYALYLKSQNFHWNVTGENFTVLHAFFEEQYTELASVVDEIAERIRALGVEAPGSFAEFARLTSLSDAKSDLSGKEMLTELLSDQQLVIQTLQKASVVADTAKDEATLDMLNARLASHQKTIWMIHSQLQS